MATRLVAGALVMAVLELEDIGAGVEGDADVQTHARPRDRRPVRGLTVSPRSGELINVQIPETTLD